MVEYRQNYTAIVVYFSCGVCLWGRWEAMLVTGRIEALGCFTKMCVCGSRGWDRGWSDNRAEGFLYCPSLPAVSQRSGLFWWMRC